MVQRFKETCHRVFTSARALGRGILKRLKEKKPYASTRMLQVQNFFSADIYGAVSDWSGQLGQSPNETEPTSERFTTKEESVNQDVLKSVNSQEVNSVVDSSRSQRACGNRLRENL